MTGGEVGVDVGIDDQVVVEVGGKVDQVADVQYQQSKDRHKCTGLLIPDNAKYYLFDQNNMFLTVVGMCKNNYFLSKVKFMGTTTK